MKLTIPHAFGRQEALARVQALLLEAKSKMGEKVSIQEERWEADTLHYAFTAEGQSISGTVEITDTAYLIDTRLPFMLRMFEGRIKAAIESQAKQMLGSLEA